MTREQIKETAMSKIDDGGPVHPVHGYQMDAGGAYCGQWVAENGLSIRDYFAAAALQGIMANPESERNILVVAKIAYDQADAMLQQRKEQP